MAYVNMEDNKEVVEVIRRVLDVMMRNGFHTV